MLTIMLEEFITNVVHQSSVCSYIMIHIRLDKMLNGIMMMLVLL